MCMSPALKRYNQRLIWIALFYAAVLIGSTYGHKHHLLGMTGGIAAALLLAASLMGNYVAIGLYLAEEQDEYLRMLMTQRSLCASGSALGVATIWGYLQSFGIVGAPAAFQVCLLWYGGLALGYPAAALAGASKR